MAFGGCVFGFGLEFDWLAPALGPVGMERLACPSVDPAAICSPVIISIQACPSHADINGDQNITSPSRTRLAPGHVAWVIPKPR